MKTFLAHLGGNEFRVLRLQDAPTAGAALSSPQAIVDYLRPKLAESLIYKPDVENFIVIHLNTRFKPIGFEVISNGTLDTLLVHAREVFRSAILANSASIIVAHNHPSGDSSPSDADVAITRNLMRAGQLLKIELTDHIVLGQPSAENASGFTSLRETGRLYL